MYEAGLGNIKRLSQVSPTLPQNKTKTTKHNQALKGHRKLRFLYHGVCSKCGRGGVLEQT